METLHGHVTAVGQEIHGDEVAVAVVAGAVEVEVYDAGDFDETGGHFIIDGDSSTVYAYGTFEEGDEFDVLLDVSPALPTLDADTRLDVWNAAAGDVVSEWVATVADDVDGSAIQAPIAHELIDMLGEDVRGLMGESVVCTQDEDTEAWMVTEVLGKTPTVDGTFIEPETLPDPTTPTEPPAASPVVTAVGLTESVLLRTEPIEATTWLTYQSSPDGSTWSDLPDMPVRSTVYVARSLADGTALAADTTYYFRVVAGNVAGDADPSASVTTSLDTSVVALIASELISENVIAGFALLGRVEIGGSTFTLSPPSADDSGGLRIELTNGGLIHLPADGTAPRMLGVERAEIENLVANGLTVSGDSLFSGDMRVGATVDNPENAPDVNFDFQLVADFSQILSNVTLNGLCRNASDDGWVATGASPGGGTAYTCFVPDVGEPTRTASALVGVRGITRIGTVYFAVDDTTSIYRYSSFGPTTDLENDWDARRLFVVGLGDIGDWWPTIGTDGTNLQVAIYTASNDLEVHTVDPTTLATIGSPLVLSAADSSPGHLGGFYEGSADFGGTRRVVVHHTKTPRVYDGTSRVSGAEWDRGADNLRGLWWDGSHFYVLTYAGRIRRLSRVAGTSAISASYAWRTDTGTYSTAASPAASPTWPARKYATITADPAPEAGSAEANAADSVAVYASYSSALSRRLQSVLAIGQRSLTTDLLDTGSVVEPTVNDFLAIAAPGEIFASVSHAHEAEPTWYQSGGGPGAVGDLTWDADGTTGWRGQTTDILASLTAASGWTLQAARYMRFGPEIRLYVELTRTGGTITVGSGGNISPDVAVLTGIPADIRPATRQPGDLKRISVLTGKCEIDPSGAIDFTDGPPSASFANAADYRIFLAYTLGL